MCWTSGDEIKGFKYSDCFKNLQLYLVLLFIYLLKECIQGEGQFVSNTLFCDTWRPSTCPVQSSYHITRTTDVQLKNCHFFLSVKKKNTKYYKSYFNFGNFTAYLHVLFPNYLLSLVILHEEKLIWANHFETSVVQFLVVVWPPKASLD